MRALPALPSASAGTLSAVSDEPIGKDDLLVLRDGSSSLLVLVTELEGSGDAVMLKRGCFKLPDGQNEWVYDRPIQQYRRATVDEVAAAREHNLLPEH